MCSFAIILKVYFHILPNKIRCFTLASYLPSPEFRLNLPALRECFIGSSAQQTAHTKVNVAVMLFVFEPE
jgi:hypothetical protein